MLGGRAHGYWGVEDFRAVIKGFYQQIPAYRLVGDLGVDTKVVSRVYQRLRQVIYHLAAMEGAESRLSGAIELDEAYCGGGRKGMRGRGAAGKVPAFGLLKRGGKVFTKIVPDARQETLLPILHSKIRPDSIGYTGAFGSYDILHVLGFRHRRVNHSKRFVAKGGKHINGIENLWNQAKRHPRKYNGIPRQNFNLFLKECQWRFNYGPPSRLLETLLRWSSLKPAQKR